MPTPAGPKIETRCGSRSPDARSQRASRIAISLVRPTIDEVVTCRSPAAVRALHRHPGRDGLRLALRQHGVGLRVLDCIPRREVGLLTDDDPVHRSRGLEARSRVHDVARDERLAELDPRAQGHDGFAGVDGDPDLQIPVGELSDAVADDERGPHRAFGVVAVGERRTEQPHHRIADELLDDAAERLDLAPDALRDTAPARPARPRDRAALPGR